MALGLLGAVRDLPRLHDITSVLIRYGLGDLVRRAGVGTAVERAGEILNWRAASEAAHLELPVRVRMALEELGPTFVKLGQMLSTREDLFDATWIAEFERLQSQVTPIAFDALRIQAELALGASLESVFTEVEETPLASASIAQVHRARLPGGAPVVLKIRRPGIQSTVEADLRILDHVARLMEENLPELRRYQPQRVVAQFARSLQRELDLAVEARNIERFARHFADDTDVLIPAIHRQWSSPTMNVQEYIEAIPGNDMDAIRKAGLDTRVLARRGTDAVLKMILVHGLFHADPHPGNVFYLPGDRIVIIDFGMVGRLSRARREQIIDLLSGVARHDADAVTDVVLEWTGDGNVDEGRLSDDLEELLFDFSDAPLKDVRIAALLRQVTDIMREHSIVLPADLTLMFKALITLEGLGRQYDPEFRLVDHLGPFLESALTQRHRPDELVRRGRESITRMTETLSGIPKDLARLLRDARRGRMRVDLDLKRLDAFGQRLDDTIDRITVGIMTASLVIGSSIVMTVQSGPTVLGVPLLTTLGLLGYLVAFFNSVWIIISIWRSKRG